jgi:hypothetical protein
MFKKEAILMLLPLGLVVVGVVSALLYRLFG